MGVVVINKAPVIIEYLYSELTSTLPPIKHLSSCKHNRISQTKRKRGIYKAFTRIYEYKNIICN
jgi:hypothetical protein